MERICIAALTIFNYIIYHTADSNLYFCPRKYFRNTTNFNFMRFKDFVLNCTTRQFVLLLNLVEKSIDDLESSLILLGINPRESSVYNDYLDLHDKLKKIKY